MKKVLQVALVSSLMLLMGVSAFAQTIGYIDVQQVFTQYEKTKAAQADIKEKEMALQKEIETKQKEIEAARNANKSEEQIKKLIETMEKELEPKRNELFEIRERLTAEIQNDIVQATKSAAKEMGIDIVLDKQVLIVGGTDITELVIGKLNR